MGDNIDAALIKWAGSKTPEEVEALTGVPALQVAQRTKAALGKIDYLEIAEKRAKLILMLEGIIAEVDSRKEDASDRNLAGLLNASRAAAATILKEMRDIEKSSKVDVNAITSNQGRVLGEIVDIAVGHLRTELKEKYGVDDDEIDEKLGEGMQMAQQQLAARVSE